MLMSSNYALQSREVVLQPLFEVAPTFLKSRGCSLLLVLCKDSCINVSGSVYTGRL